MDPAITTRTSPAEAVNHCVLAAYQCGEVEQPLVHEPQFRMQHGKLTPCLAVQKCLVSKVCNFLVGQPNLTAWHVSLARRQPCGPVQVLHSHCVPGAQGCGGDLVPRSCRMRCGLPVTGAPRSSAHCARPRLARLVRFLFRRHCLSSTAPVQDQRLCFLRVVKLIGCVVPSGHPRSATLCG